ncbi:MarR family winged helix-turn-helix transcriptional regulator [Streptomyces zingiberis]|uniref:MarR family transcriptional regulator n=1 Tax=Streptomyces zingiberis TaxID=2053010 RepID=A0ABX1BS44_9ACTN|nr:MarR family transcriptional regulator [Streptomyces zingiberis]NJQ00542.1 MarR family transcriptional regulator [Streptomyces zingiberis]
MTPPPNTGRGIRARTGPDDGPGRAAVWHDLILATHLLETALERQTQRDGGISHGHFKLLVLLSAAEDRTLGLKSLADVLRFSQSRVSHALAALERQGLVTRRPVAGGRRASEATLTREGQLLVSRVLRSQRREIRDPLFDGLGETATAALGDAGARIVSFLDGDRTAAPQRADDGRGTAPATDGP